MNKIIERLNNIRQPKTDISLLRKILCPIVLIIISGFLGVIFKYFDTNPFWNVLPNKLCEGLKDIGSMFSFWVLTTTLIACFSYSPLSAGFKSFCYLFSMVVTYYIYQARLFRYFSKRYFIFWSVAAVFSFFGGYFVWYARGDGKFATFCSTIPPTIILQEAFLFIILEVLRYHRIVCNHTVMFIFCILATILLLLLLPTSKK